MKTLPGKLRHTRLFDLLRLHIVSPQPARPPVSRMSEGEAAEVLALRDLASRSLLAPRGHMPRRA